MGVFSQVGRLVENLFDLVVSVISGLIDLAIWAVGFVIDIVADVLGWINGALEALLGKGATEVNVLKGNAIADFVREKQKEGRYTEISLSQLNALNNSAINVAMDKEGNVVEDQMIRSRDGLSADAEKQFDGQPILKIKIPN